MVVLVVLYQGYILICTHSIRPSGSRNHHREVLESDRKPSKLLTMTRDIISWNNKRKYRQFHSKRIMSAADPSIANEREQILEQYRSKIREHREVEARLKRMREDVRGLVERYQKTEDDLSALQSVGQIIGDVLKRLDAERFIVKASSGPRYVVGCRTRLNYDKLKPGTRVALDMTTLTIMRVLPREVDPTVFHMQSGEEDGGVSFSEIGGLSEQIRELREVIELPLTNPELFVRVGIKVCFTYRLLYNTQ